MLWNERKEIPRWSRWTNQNPHIPSSSFLKSFTFKWAWLLNISLSLCPGSFSSSGLGSSYGHMNGGGGGGSGGGSGSMSASSAAAAALAAATYMNSGKNLTNLLPFFLPFFGHNSGRKMSPKKLLEKKAGIFLLFSLDIIALYTMVINYCCSPFSYEEKWQLLPVLLLCRSSRARRLQSLYISLAARVWGLWNEPVSSDSTARLSRRESSSIGLLIRANVLVQNCFFLSFKSWFVVS